MPPRRAAEQRRFDGRHSPQYSPRVRCWEEAVCVERTELVQLQRPPNVCMLVHARVRTKTRGNPDRGMRVLLARGQGCCSEPCGNLLTELLSPGGRKRLTLRMLEYSVFSIQ